MTVKMNKAGYPEPGVYSQSGVLHEVLLHRPNIALSRLTPENLHELLFDDMPLPEVALQHYDLFVQMLRDNGVQVTFLHDCMVEALKEPGAKKFVLDKRTDLDRFSVMKKDIYQWLMEISEDDLALYLTGGLLFADLPKEIRKTGFIAANQPATPPPFVLRPLPNQMFCRDTSGWAHNGVALCNMYYDARKLEVVNLGLVYRFSPRFKGCNIWTNTDLVGGVPAAATFEGGDIMPICKDHLLMGTCERTRREGIEYVAKAMFDQKVVKRVIVVEMPPKRSFMHLDGAFAPLANDSYSMLEEMLDQCPCYILTPEDDGGIKVASQPGGLKGFVMASVCRSEKVKWLTVAGDYFRAQFESWCLAANGLCLGNRKVIGYDRNIYTNKVLRDNGIDLIELPATELMRAHGGPDCMTCPVRRDPDEA